MTIDDKGGTHQKMTGDDAEMEKKVKDQKNHQSCPMQDNKILQLNCSYSV